jgi:hypothetical protein
MELILVKSNYQINDVVYSFVNGALIKTRIIKLYPPFNNDHSITGHIGIYSGEPFPYEKSFDDVAETVEQLLKQIRIEDYTKFKI